MRVSLSTYRWQLCVILFVSAFSKTTLMLYRTASVVSQTMLIWHQHHRWYHVIFDSSERQRWCWISNVRHRSYQNQQCLRHCWCCISGVSDTADLCYFWEYLRKYWKNRIFFGYIYCVTGGRFVKNQRPNCAIVPLIILIRNSVCVYVPLFLGHFVYPCIPCTKLCNTCPNPVLMKGVRKWKGVGNKSPFVGIPLPPPAESWPVKLTEAFDTWQEAARLQATKQAAGSFPLLPHSLPLPPPPHPPQLRSPAPLSFPHLLSDVSKWRRDLSTFPFYSALRNNVQPV